MNSSTINRRFISKNFLYIIATALVSIPLFVVMTLLVKSFGIHEDEAAATGFTILVLAGVFAGRYIGNIIAYKRNDYPKRMLTALSVVVVVLTFWIFFYTEFPLRDRPSLSFLLFALPIFVLSVLMGIIIKVVRAITQKQLTEAKSLAANSASELQLLQSQISPHFLFNTLNNMYGLSITRHEKIPPLLLKLSDLLRYSVYDASKPFVPVKDELAYINNYIDFEKMRIGERLSLTTDFEDFSYSNARIAPMLLIVFIENAFKHSKNTASENIFIHMSLKTWCNRLLFTCVNSYQGAHEKVSAEQSGLGLENTRKRLDLLYGKDHHLIIEDNDDTYKVMLQLKIR